MKLSQMKEKPTGRELNYLKLWDEWEARRTECSEEEREAELAKMERQRELAVDYCESTGQSGLNPESPYTYMFYAFCGAVDVVCDALGKLPEDTEELLPIGGKGELA